MVAAEVIDGLPFADVWRVVVVVIVVVGGLAVLLGVLGARRERRVAATGGSGKVVGIVGRMGSGKSYMAVRMAYRRLQAGANVCTNFSMRLPDELAARWTQFRGWEDFAVLEDAVVIIDEAQLYAPSNKTLVFPNVARWKLAQARKFGLDVYWISQHEARVNTIIRDLTHMVYVCRAYAGGKFFVAYGYEPEDLRKEGKHIDRQSYRFDLAVGQMYDTLQILDADDHLVVKDASMAAAQELGRAYNERRGIDGAAGLVRRRRCSHEIQSNKPRGACRECVVQGTEGDGS